MGKCKGYNCKSVDGTPHSDECLLEHNHAVQGFTGNDYPVARTRGYKKEELWSNATDAEKSAWWEGFIAREDT